MPTSPQTSWESMVDEAMSACVEIFGEGEDQVTYTHLDGSPFTLNGIFESATEDVDPNTGVMILSNKPMFSAGLGSFQQIPDQGDTAVIRGQTYRVIEPIFDGQGTVTLRLHKVT